MPKPKKIQYNGDSKVIAALANVGNWLLDNALSAIPIASSNSLGGIKVGQNLTIENDGTLNAEAGGSGVDVTPILLSGTKIAEISITEGTSETDYDIYAPTPDTVYDSRITIRKNDTEVDSFTLNQNSNKSINISVPTKTSDLTNDSGFITSYTDEKITAEEKNPTSEKTYNIPFTDGTTNQKPFINDGIKYKTLQGTSGSSGIANLVLGNDIASGTAGNKYGNLRIYSRSQYFANVIPTNNLTANRTFTLPDKSGTAATTDDIPTITDTYDGTSSDGMSGKAVKSAIDALDVTTSGAGAGKTLTALSQTDGKISATFGNISITKSQVSDFPTIPTVNNSTITIQKNSTTVDSFTLNQSTDKTINISVPTKTSDLTNDSGFVTDGQGAKTVKSSLVTLTDAAAIYAEDITADIEPIQSGSGTPSPSNIRPIQGHDECEVERVGKNLLNKSDVSVSASTTWLNQPIELDSGTYTFSMKSSTTSGYYTVVIRDANNNDLYNSGNISLANSNAKSFTISGKASKILSYINVASTLSDIQLELGNQATTYEPYQGQDYVMPLSNKNLIPMQFDNTHILAYNTSGSWNDHTYTEYGVDITVYTLTKYSDIVTGIRIKGYATGNLSFMLCSYGDDFVFAEALKMNASGTSNADIDIVAMDKNNTPKAEIRTTLSSADVSVTDNKFAKVVVIVNSGFSGDVMIYPQIRKAKYSADFAPHNPRLPEAVYGGTLDVTSGELVINKKLVDLGSLSWSRTSSRFYASISDIYNYAFSDVADLLCSCYTKSSWNGAQDKDFVIFSAQGYVSTRDSRYTDATEYKTAVTGQTLLYPLATPITYQLTPQEVKLLLNLNNITASTGQVQVKYQPNNAIGEAIGYIQDYIERHEPKTYYPKII